MAEEFRFEQLGRNIRAVDGDERLGGPGTGLMNRLGNQFLAGAAFAGNQNGGAGRGYLFDEAKDFLHHLRSVVAKRQQRTDECAQRRFVLHEKAEELVVMLVVCTDLVGVMYLYRSFLGRLQWSVAITSTLKPAVIDFTRSLA